jgi:hypothetical protein
VRALTKEKKEKDNVFIDLESINLKNVSLLQSKELRRKTTKAKIDNSWRIRSIREFCNISKHNCRGHRNKGRVWIQLVSRKD